MKKMLIISHDFLETTLIFTIVQQKVLSFRKQSRICSVIRRQLFKVSLNDFCHKPTSTIILQFTRFLLTVLKIVLAFQHTLRRESIHLIRNDVQISNLPLAAYYHFGHKLYQKCLLFLPCIYLLISFSFHITKSSRYSAVFNIFYYIHRTCVHSGPLQ